jgi:hypothetical protein
MKLVNLVEALGLGAAREARQLVARLPGRSLAVVTVDGAIARALERAGHRALSPEAGPGDAALALALPEDGQALPALERLFAATRPGGMLGVASAASSSSLDRARVAGLFLRVGCGALRQEVDGSLVLTSAQVLAVPGTTPTS